MKLVKYVSAEISSPLSYIFNLSVDQGVFPCDITVRYTTVRYKTVRYKTVRYIRVHYKTVCYKTNVGTRYKTVHNRMIRVAKRYVTKGKSQKRYFAKILHVFKFRKCCWLP
jgi:hypothetical protein